MLSESNAECDINKLPVSSISVMWVTDSKLFWYMVFISYDTGVVHTLSYLLFSVAPDLLYCRGMDEHHHEVQLFTLKSSAGSQPTVLT